jgi:hypothetical protein
MDYKDQRWETVVNYFSRILTAPEDVLHINGQDIPFVNNVTYIGVVFNRKIIWSLHSKGI